MVEVVAVSGAGWGVLGVVFVCLWVTLAFWPARVAGRKGHSFLGYFIFSLFFFPLALLVAIHVPGPHSAGAGLTANHIEPA